MIDMKIMTATEVARNFSDVLTEVEQEGEVVVITRGTREVAELRPRELPTGRDLIEFFSRRHLDPDDADRWLEEIAEWRSAAKEREIEWPD